MAYHVVYVMGGVLITTDVISEEVALRAHIYSALSAYDDTLENVRGAVKKEEFKAWHEDVERNIKLMSQFNEIKKQREGESMNNQEDDMTITLTEQQAIAIIRTLLVRQRQLQAALDSSKCPENFKLMAETDLPLMREVIDLLK